MSKFISVDTTEIDQLLFFFRRKFPDAVDAAIRNYVNDLAFDTKKKTRSTLNTFKFTNNSTRKFTQRGIFVQKAARGSMVPESEVGATGSLKGSTRTSRKASYLARQELGGTVTQLKSSGVGERQNLIAPNPVFNRQRKLNKLAGKIAKPTKGLRNKQAMASAIQNARSKNKRIAGTPYGLYRVNKGSARLIWKYKGRGTITTPKTPWLQPAVDKVMVRRDAVFKGALNFQLRRIRGLKGTFKI